MGGQLAKLVVSFLSRAAGSNPIGVSETCTNTMSSRAPGRRQRSAGTSTAVSACALQAHRASLLRLEPADPGTRRGPSLAQRLGLAPAPPAPLTPFQWLERQQVRSACLRTLIRQPRCLQEAICGS